MSELKTVRFLYYFAQSVTDLQKMELWKRKSRFFNAGCSWYPEIEALNPKTGDQRPKPREFGSNPDSWQPYAAITWTPKYFNWLTHTIFWLPNCNKTHVARVPGGVHSLLVRSAVPHPAYGTSIGVRDQRDLQYFRSNCDNCGDPANGNTEYCPCNLKLILQGSQFPLNYKFVFTQMTL